MTSIAVMSAMPVAMPPMTRSVRPQAGAEVRQAQLTEKAEHGPADPATCGDDGSMGTVRYCSEADDDPSRGARQRMSAIGSLETP